MTYPAVTKLTVARGAWWMAVHGTQAENPSTAITPTNIFLNIFITIIIRNQLFQPNKYNHYFPLLANHEKNQTFAVQAGMA